MAPPPWLVFPVVIAIAAICVRIGLCDCLGRQVCLGDEMLLWHMHVARCGKPSASRGLLSG